MTLKREFPPAVAFKDLRINHGSFPVRNSHFYNIWYIDPRTPKYWGYLAIVPSQVKKTFFQMMQQDDLRSLVIEDCGTERKHYSREERSVNFIPNKSSFPREEMGLQAGFGGQEGRGASLAPSCCEVSEKTLAHQNKKGPTAHFSAPQTMAAVAASTHQ
ncbi:hypothetical protein [Kordiimonas sp. SCSIO 12610]|uniref:hypothetical protein n=1 Tax=Kordiimonas sp. SCSIO 12610 TaxID=2829597 RepID=UPI00210B566D|nr:hypothetical protein [Kordiimonas sp. SCSIO 12610]UTW53952.1 hypothetical protein KFF44_08870 [Kordiimonas sp. SCSIO 12610]